MISIIIPVFNMQDYLAEAIESCIKQTKPPLEIIVVDDGSTDRSLEIARTYESYKVKVISQTNRGLACARNTGIMNATGDYILPLDADDILLPNAIEFIDRIISETNIDIVSPSFKTIGTSNEVVTLINNPTVDDFKTGNRVGYCSAIKRSKLLEIGGYSSRMVEGWEDYHLWFNLLSRGATIKTTTEVLWLYRTKEKSMWTESKKYEDKLWAQIRKDFPKLFA